METPPDIGPETSSVTSKVVLSANEALTEGNGFTVINKDNLEQHLETVADAAAFFAGAFIVPREGADGQVKRDITWLADLAELGQDSGSDFNFDEFMDNNEEAVQKAVAHVTQIITQILSEELQENGILVVKHSDEGKLVGAMHVLFYESTEQGEVAGLEKEVVEEEGVDWSTMLYQESLQAMKKACGDSAKPHIYFSLLAAAPGENGVKDMAAWLYRYADVEKLPILVESANPALNKERFNRHYGEPVGTHDYLGPFREGNQRSSAPQALESLLAMQADQTSVDFYVRKPETLSSV